MFIEFDSGEAIERVIRTSTFEHEDFGPEFEPQVRPADEKFGDFQANGVLPFAKKAKLNPRDLALTRDLQRVRGNKINYNGRER